MTPTASNGLLLAAVMTLAACQSQRSQPAPAPEPDTTAPGGGAPGESCVLVDEGAGPKGQVPVQAQTVVAGLEVPWGLAFLPGGDILVTERPGRIRVVRQGALSEPIATIPIAPGGEGGLLGLALHPDFAANRLFYIYYTGPTQNGNANRVERWTLSQDGASASLERVILEGIPAARYHDGGRLRFGPDGHLYVGTGDAGEPELAQQRDTMAGKVLRVTDVGEAVDGNLAPGNRAYVLGVRNVQAFDWDSHGLVIADHGPSGELGRRGHDEITRARAGANLGWPTIYGCQSQQGLSTPSITWREAAPPGGAAFYTGDRIPEWKGNLLVGTLGSKHLHRVVFDSATPARVSQHEAYFEGDPPGGHGRLRDVIMGPDGELYVTTSNCDGRGTCPSDKDRILRITR